MEVKVIENLNDLPARNMRCLQVIGINDDEKALHSVLASYQRSGYPPAKVVYKFGTYFYFDLVGDDTQVKE